MTFNQNQPPTRGNSSSFEPSGFTGNEVNLYEDLLTFSELPPAERLRDLAPPDEPLPAPQPEAIASGEEAELPNGAQEDTEAPGPDSEAHPAADSPPLWTESGPLGNAEFAFKGALSEGICLNCGAESGAENLFCAACASFDEEAGARSVSDAACRECGEYISAEDVFCPECGALLTSS